MISIGRLIWAFVRVSLFIGGVTLLWQSFGAKATVGIALLTLYSALGPYQE